MAREAGLPADGLSGTPLWATADDNLSALWVVHADMSAYQHGVDDGHIGIVDQPVPEVRLGGDYHDVEHPDGASHDWQYLVATYTDWNVALMLRIIDCESGGRADAVSSTADYGLFQIHGEPSALDPQIGAEFAHEKFLASGYSPWRSSRGCWGA